MARTGGGVGGGGALLRLYSSSVKALLRTDMRVRMHYKGSIQALFRLYRGSIKAPLRLYLRNPIRRAHDRHAGTHTLLRHYQSSMKAI